MIHLGIPDDEVMLPSERPSTLTLTRKTGVDFSLDPEDIEFDPHPNAGGMTMFPVMRQSPFAEASLGTMIRSVMESTTLPETAKALTPPPQVMPFGQISYMPDPAAKGVMQEPGISSEALAKIARECIAPQMIIGQRESDLIRYSQLSDQTWKPGWSIEPVDKTDHPSAQTLKDIRECERFVQNCTIETGGAIERDEQGYDSFTTFLGKLVRDTFTFDRVAVWKDTDEKGRVKAFKLLPGGNVRFAAPGGYNGNKKLNTVLVDDGNRVHYAFTREQVTTYVRNPRSNPEVGSYGLSEIEVAIRLIQAFQFAIDLNANAFDRNSIPNGILTISGGTVTQRQLDLLNRIWTNFKRGVTKSWSLPVIALHGDSKLEILDLHEMKGMEGMYKDLMNMLAGMFCTIYRFPPHRLGYRVSGHGRDTDMPSSSGTNLTDEDDPGLAPLLIHIEQFINPYIVATRYPHLRFVFRGKTPKEDARAYEARKNAQTWGESRKEAGIVPLEQLAEGEDLKKIARLMSIAPVDPNLSGVFQSIAAAFIKGESDNKDASTPGNRMTSSVDPARSEQHGKPSGVRRDSRAEGRRAAS